MRMLRLRATWRFVLCLLVVCSAALGLAGVDVRAQAPTPVEISITRGGFDPAELQVPVGTELVWINDDTVEHRLVSLDGDFAPQVFAPGGEFAISLQVPGRYNFQVDDDPAFTGIVEVTSSVRDLDAAPAAGTPAAEAPVVPTVTPTAAGPAQNLTPVDTPRLAHVHAGNCTELGIVVYSFRGAQSYRIEPETEDRGPVELLVGTANVALPDLFTEPFSIHVHESSENKQNYIACTDIGGQPDAPWSEADGLVLPLVEQADSGLSGFATLRPAPDGGTDVGLFLSGPIAAAAPEAPANTTPPTTYTSPTFGYSISYNTTWDVTEDLSSNGRDRFVLTNGTSYVTFTGAEEFAGDPAACVAGFQDDLLADPNVSNVAVRTGPDGEPLVGETPATGAFAVFNHDYAFATGTVPYTLFVGCIPLIPGEAVLAVVQNVPAADFESESAARDGLLRGLVLNQ